MGDENQVRSHDTASSRQTYIVRAALLPALATVLVWTPALLSIIPAISGIDSSEASEGVIPPLLLFVLYFVSAPTVALIVNWRWPAATNADRATFAALLQILVSPVLAVIFVWLDVQRGYESNEAGVIGLVFNLLVILAVITGVFLTMLVAVFGRIGAWLAQGRQGPGSDADGDNDVAATHAGQLGVGRTETSSKRNLAIGFAAAGGLVVLVVASFSFISARAGSDNHCSEAEQQAMFEFPHYGDAKPDWQSNAGTSGGCAARFSVDAAPGEVRDYYQEQLRQRGWNVKEGPANPFFMDFDAERAGVQSSLRFESANSREKDPTLKPAQTQVSISGGYR